MVKDRHNFSEWYARLLKSLSSAPIRVCQSLHECSLCGGEIRLGQSYRDRGYDRRSHLTCLDRELAKL